MKLKLFRPIAFFDLETTGLDVVNDRIAEISICKINVDLTREIYTTKVNPGIPMPKEAGDVNGLTDEILAGCPLWEEIGPIVFEMLKDCDVAGFYSNKFDVPILFHSFQRIRLFWNYTKINLVDVKGIYLKNERRRLIDAVKFYLNKDHEGAHSAEADVLATIDVFLAQMELYPDMPSTVSDLAVYSNEGKKQADISGRFLYDEKGQLLFNFGKYKGKEVTVDVPYLYWAKKQKDFPIDSSIVADNYMARNGGYY